MDNERKRQIANGLVALFQLICICGVGFAILLGIGELFTLAEHNKIAEYISYFVCFGFMIFAMAVIG